MQDVKKVKEDIKRKAFKDLDRYYPTKALKDIGFILNRCKNCNKPFWAAVERSYCDEPVCSGGFRFIGDTPAKARLNYIEAWTTFAKILKKRGYTPIKRYSTVARWRDDVDFVQASIYDFQPYVVTGEVEPPANPLIVPQPCLRFNDVDAIGLTGAHYSCFVMQGQHAFVPAKKYDINSYFKDLYEWFIKGIKIPREELCIHPDSWAGGGNAGVSCEFFSRGLEIANQVYMQYQLNGKLKDLNIKVLDMGQGQERVAWFTQGTVTSYETTFPSVMEKINKITGIKVDKYLIKEFLPYSAYLNFDEVENAEKVWQEIARKIKVDAEELKKNILPLAALYSVAEHSRALLFAISDGAIPSNVGGGYNLRLLLRRALSFIDGYGWEISIPDLCNEHARFLRPLFPELSENLENVNRIIEVEKSRHESSKQKIRQIVANIIPEKLSEEKLVTLYESQGITPELIKEEAKKVGKKIKIPDDFYARISSRHEKKEMHGEEEKLNVTGIPPTEVLYYNNYRKTFFSARVLKVTGKNVVLDKTYFYPTSGGQACDTGTIDNNKVIYVFRQGNVVVHALEKQCNIPTGKVVECRIDFERRLLLAQHHTAAHILNAAAREKLGSHINQAGAKKEVDKAHLDITHYQNVSDEEVKKIEARANEIAKNRLPVNSFFMPRNKAEKKYGTRIYQGGAVPGKLIRIVEIPGVEVEACGGTHVKNTIEVDKIKIVKSTKVQDGIVRLTFLAGKAAEEELNKEDRILKEAAELLNVSPEQLPSRAEELFEKWKKARKAAKKKMKIEPEELKLVSRGHDHLPGHELLEKTAAILSTQPEHVPKTIKRFLSDIEEFEKRS